MHCLLSMWRINWWLRDSKVSPPDMATFSRGQRQTKELSKLRASGSQGFTLQVVYVCILHGLPVSAFKRTNGLKRTEHRKMIEKRKGT